MRNINKKYYDVKVLKNVNLNIFKGETLALIGENGAGKSTLIKILCGFVAKNSGEIYFDENKVKINGPQDARKLGINYILQDTALVPNFTVAQNIFLYYSGIENKISYKNSIIKRMAKDLLDKININ
ncbi:MAG: ATP-binding cassette domain-containing protein, partial [Ruthenibacterium sp.]